jgi:rhomboid protease GluP
MSEPIQTETVPAPGPDGFAPGEPASKPERSEWNPMSAPATYFLLAANIAVFLWMLASGVSIENPSIAALLHFGANSTQLVLAGQWYRLLTATFVHIGIIHIATNMWCLWNLGLLGEPLLGPWGLIAVYMLTGIAGNLLSMAWDVGLAVFLHQPLTGSIGAGASGAVFGIAGILIVLLSNKRLPIPWEELKRLRRSVVQFAVINLVIGAGTIFVGPVRIDNSAHLGGFLSGLALGPGLVPRMTAGRVRYLRRQKFVFAAAAFVLALFGYWIASLV